MVILKDIICKKVVDDQGVQVQAANIDLTGKIKSLVCAHADAIGYLYRIGNKTIISFKSNDEVTCGARPLHLKNQDIVLLESDENGTLTHNWDKIYI